MNSINKTLKEESTNKNHYDDSYSAFHIRDAPLSFVFKILTDVMTAFEIFFGIELGSFP